MVPSSSELVSHNTLFASKSSFSLSKLRALITHRSPSIVKDLLRIGLGSICLMFSKDRRSDLLLHRDGLVVKASLSEIDLESVELLSSATLSSMSFLSMVNSFALDFWWKISFWALIWLAAVHESCANDNARLVSSIQEGELDDDCLNGKRNASRRCLLGAFSFMTIECLRGRLGNDDCSVSLAFSSFSWTYGFSEQIFWTTCTSPPTNANGKWAFPTT